MKLLKKELKSISVVAEFNNTNTQVSLETIATLSDYISNVSKKISVATDLQTHPTGYRITFKMVYKDVFNIKERKLSRKLSKISQWINKTNKSTLYRYQTTFNF